MNTLFKNTALLSLVAIILFSFLVPVVSEAETVIRKGASVSLAENQIVDGDFYVLSESATISGNVNGDLYAIGGSVTVNGDIEEDLVVVAGVSQIHAATKGDLRVISGDAVLAEEVRGDVFVFAGSLQVLSTAKVTGNIYFYGGSLELAGPVSGSLVGSADSIHIDSAVEGDVSVKVSEKLALGDSATIGGDIEYTSLYDLQRAQNASVQGDVRKSTATIVQDSGELWDEVVSISIILFGVLSLYVFGRRYFLRMEDVLFHRHGFVGLVGLGILIGLPFVAVLLMITVLGLFLGGILLMAYGALLLLAYLLMHVVAGMYLSYFFTKKVRISFMWLVVGVFGLQLVLQIPLVGPIIGLAHFVLTIGTIGLMVYEIRKVS